MDYQEYVRYEPLLARRASAAILDYALVFAVCAAYIKLVGTEGADGTYRANGLHHLVVLWLFWFLYFPVVEGIFGYTLFKGAFGLKVVPDKRRDSRFAVAFKRHLLDPVDFAFFGVVGLILVKTRDDHKRLGDMVAYCHIELDAEEKTTTTCEQSSNLPQDSLADDSQDSAHEMKSQ